MHLQFTESIVYKHTSQRCNTLYITQTPPCINLLCVYPPGLPRGDQCSSGEQAAAAGDGRAPGQGQPRQQGGRDPAQTHQSQRTLATPAGPHCSQVGVKDSLDCVKRRECCVNAEFVPSL